MSHFTVPLFATVQDGQENETLYVKIDYFHTPGFQLSEYLEVELELWKSVHEERFNRGIIQSWDLYSVVAGEPDVPYNFISVNVFDDFSMIDYYDLESIIRSVYPDTEPDKIMERTQKSREVVRTEIWEINGRIMNNGQQTPGGSYLTINYFDSRGGNGEHVEMELDFWGGIHETRIDHNILNSWAMHTLVYPDGDARQYTYSTIDYYDDLEDLLEPVGMPLAKISHPGLSENELGDFFTRTGASRTVYKTELWKRIGFIGNQ